LVAANRPACRSQPSRDLALGGRPLQHVVHGGLPRLDVVREGERLGPAQPRPEAALVAALLKDARRVLEVGGRLAQA
jgi:hypothetical protein